MVWGLPNNFLSKLTRCSVLKGTWFSFLGAVSAAFEAFLEFAGQQKTWVALNWFSSTSA